MRRNLVLFIVAVFALSVLIGCGGKSQKINGVADEQSEIMDEATEAEREELPTTYLVESGDTLYGIASKPEIYGNKNQWPLIYDANRDILDDYKVLEEGQKLIIPRNVSAIEIEAAKERADELGWPGSAGGGEIIASGDDDVYSPSENVVAVSDDYEERQEDAIEVAGLSNGYAEEEEGGIVEEEYGGGGSESGYDEEAYEQPTPIPEPPKGKRKGKMNIPLVAAILFAVAGAGIFFFLSKKKKDEEEEEDGGGDSGSSGLDSTSNILE